MPGEGNGGRTDTWKKGAGEGGLTWAYQPGSIVRRLLMAGVPVSSSLLKTVIWEEGVESEE